MSRLNKHNVVRWALVLACSIWGLNRPAQGGGERNPRSLNVEPERKVDNALMPLHKSVADRLTKANLPPPQCRVAHFQYLNQPERLKFRGWHGFVTSVDPIPGGILVTLRVAPVFEMAMTSDSIIERYTVVDGVISFIGAEADPTKPRLIFGL